MKKALLLLILIVTGSFVAYNQTCNLTINTTSGLTVCPGSSVNLTATPIITYANQQFDFNNSSLPTNWVTSGGTSYGQLCGSGIDNTPYFWASTSNSVPQITTAAFDVCSGGTIKFDMRYAIQGGSSPCEGPDLRHEGVSLEYSLNNGANWVLINYFRPDGQILTYFDNSSSSAASGATPFTTWATYTIPIPTAAISPNSMFRWIQVNSSGGCCDNWGLDNIFINAGPCNTNIAWSTGETDVITINPTINTDSCFIASVYDINDVLLCTSDPICFTLHVPQIEAGPDQTPCENTPITLAASNGTNFTWNNGVIDNTPFTVNYTGSPTKYIVNGIDVNGCAAKDSLLVNAISLSLPTISYAKESYCANETNPTPTVTGSTSGTFTITPAGPTINPTTGEITLNTSTTSPFQTYTINYISSNQCVGSATATLDIYSLPTATITSDVTVCQNSTEPTLTLTGSNATAPYTFNYSINNGPTQSVTSTGNSTTISASTATDGTFTYQLLSVSEGSENACTNSTNNAVVVTILPSPPIQIPTNYSICFGDSTSITATGVSGLQWNNGIQNGIYFTPTQTQTYTVSGVNTNGCENSASVTITVNPLPPIFAGNDTTICVGFPYPYHASGGTSYTWSNGAVNQTNGLLPIGNHTLEVIGIDQNGCVNRDTLMITVVPSVDPSFTMSETEIYENASVTFTNTTSGSNYYSWDFGNGSTANTSSVTPDLTSEYTHPGSYVITLIANNGYCAVSVTQTLIVLPYPDPILHIPNVFTPNGDLANDTWAIDVTFGKEIEVIILNRWGDLMATLTTFDMRWDGKSKGGNDATEGVYFFKYNIVGLNNKTYTGHGHVTLER